jgi:phosphoglycolate phosphatase
MLFKTVLFDFDYTLADSSEGASECVNYALKKMSLPVQSFSTICKTIGLSLSDTFFTLTNNNDPNNFEIFKGLFIERERGQANYC